MSLCSASFPTRVLVVDSRPDVCNQLTEAIKAEHSLRMLGIESGVKSALAWLQQHRADLVIVNPALADGTGLDLIRACTQRDSKLEVLVVADQADARSVLACIEAGARGYLLRVGGSVDIAGAVRELRNGASPLSPWVARVLVNRIRSDALSSTLSPDAKERLTPREKDVLNLIARGESYGEVARILAVSLGTVQTHIKKLYSKLGVHSRSEAVFEAHCRGLLSFGRGAQNK
jgi:DNA-binding NarL/FixJ family response regulator